MGGRVRGVARWHVIRARLWLQGWRHPRIRHDLARRFIISMEQANGHHPGEGAPQGGASPVTSGSASAVQSSDGATPETGQASGETGNVKEHRPRLLILVRHGESTFNVEGRHPGQLPGIPLTDQGRRQAHAAAVALAALPLSAIITSPLERARETAEIIARGWGLPVYLDARLKDTEVGPFAGKTIAELKDVPEWKAFVEHPDAPPPGVESLEAVQRRAVAVVDDILRDAGHGSYVVVVAHADVVKLVIGHYLNITTESARHIGVGNASLSALLFHAPDQPPEVLSLNWSPLPHWLHAPVPTQAEAPANALPAEKPSERANEGEQAPPSGSPNGASATPSHGAGATPEQAAAARGPSEGQGAEQRGTGTPCFLDFM